MLIMSNAKIQMTNGSKLGGREATRLGGLPANEVWRACPLMAPWKSGML